MKNDPLSRNVYHGCCRYADTLSALEGILSASQELYGTEDRTENELSDDFQDFAQAFKAFSEACLEAPCSDEISREVQLCQAIMDSIDIVPGCDIVRAAISVVLVSTIIQKVYDTLLLEGL